MIRKGYVETPWGAVHFRTAGGRAPERTPVVLLHQTASSSAMFEGMIERLSDRFFVIAPDTPGFGESFAPLERPTVRFYARVLFEACRRLEIAACDLFGHHSGASIAAQLAHDRPAFVRRLALSGPPCLTREERRAFAAKTVPLRVDDDGEYLAKLWRRLRAKDPDAPRALTHREATLTMRAGERWHEAYDAVFEHDLAALLPAIGCPTLVTCGDRDTLRFALERAHAALPNGAMREIAGGTTYVCDRQPDAMAAILRDFFGAER